MTTNHPAHGPVSLDRLHQISEILSKASAQSDGGNLGYAMADAVKVIDGAIAAFGVEPVAWIVKNKESGDIEIAEPHETATNPKYWTDAFPVYTAPPATEPMKDHQIRELVNDLLDIAVEYHGTQQLRERIARTVRSAMLQAGNSPVTPDCSCRTCRPVTFTDSRFVVCPECGNKRCPRASDHRNACTGSNEPGQEGSAYPAAPQQEVK